MGHLFEKGETADIDDSTWVNIHRVLGNETARRFRRALAGKDIRVPFQERSLHNDHFLVLAIGAEAARTLVREFGGIKMYVSRGENVRERRVLTLAEKGLTNAQIAEALEISERHVRTTLGLMGVRNPNRSPRKPLRICGISPTLIAVE